MFFSEPALIANQSLTRSPHSMQRYSYCQYFRGFPHPNSRFFLIYLTSVYSLLWNYQQIMVVSLYSYSSPSFSSLLSSVPQSRGFLNSMPMNPPRTYFYIRSIGNLEQSLSEDTLHYRMPRVLIRVSLIRVSLRKISSRYIRNSGCCC